MDEDPRPSSGLEVKLEDEVTPAWPVVMPWLGYDGAARRIDGRGVERLVHTPAGDAPVILRARPAPRDRVHLAVHAASDDDAEWGMARARFWTCVDDDLTEFAHRFADDPLIGHSLATRPHLRPARRPAPFEALLLAVCEQLIDGDRATKIKRALMTAHGRPHPSGLRDLPSAAQIAALSPPELQRCGLTQSRATALIRCAREIARGRVTLDGEDPATHRAGWRRLRAIPGIGPWTLSCLALHGQGHHDALPAGDHGYRVLVARHRQSASLATEAEVAEFFAPYAPWRGVAGWHLLHTNL